MTVENLEQTRSLLQDGTTDGGQMTARFADLCDELAGAVTGLLSLQERLANTDTDSLQRLDSLVQTASTLLQQQQKTAGVKRPLTAVGGGSAATVSSSRRRLQTARNRRADSSSPSSGRCLAVRVADPEPTLAL